MVLAVKNIPGDVVSFGAKGFERQLKNVAPGEVSQNKYRCYQWFSQIYSLARKIHQHYERWGR